MNEDRDEVFRGHLEECLRHFGTSLASSVPKGSRGAAQAKKPVADFWGVTINSVSRWLNNTGSFPVGEPLIKLMCYLDMVGYRVIEFERIPKARRSFAELIGYGFFSGSQAAEFLGYSSTSTLYQVLQGNQNASEDKDQKMWDAWKERKDELEQRKKKLQEPQPLDASIKARPETEVPRASERPASSSCQTAVVSIMEGLLALFEGNPFEKLPDSELTNLHRSAATVLRLSAHLSALSSHLITFAEQRKGGS